MKFFLIWRILIINEVWWALALVENGTFLISLLNRNRSYLNLIEEWGTLEQEVRTREQGRLQAAIAIADCDLISDCRRLSMTSVLRFDQSTEEVRNEDCDCDSLLCNAPGLDQSTMSRWLPSSAVPLLGSSSFLGLPPIYKISTAFGPLQNQSY